MATKSWLEEIATKDELENKRMALIKENRSKNQTKQSSALWHRQVPQSAGDDFHEVINVGHRWLHITSELRQSRGELGDVSTRVSLKKIK